MICPFPISGLFARSACVLLAFTGVTLSAQSTLAQPAGSIAAPQATAPGPAGTQATVPSEPGVTTASFGDWTLRCQRLDANGQVGRVCEVSHTIQVQGQAGPIAQVAIGRLKSADPLRVTVVLPVNVSFPGAVQIATDEKNVKALDLPWRRCLPTGCFADNALSDEALARWRSLRQPGRILFKDASERELTIPLSLRGLGQAFDALAKERL
jgi:invasion protein IalB